MTVHRITRRSVRRAPLVVVLCLAAVALPTGSADAALGPAEYAYGWRSPAVEVDGAGRWLRAQSAYVGTAVRHFGSIRASGGSWSTPADLGPGVDFGSPLLAAGPAGSGVTAAVQCGGSISCIIRAGGVGAGGWGAFDGVFAPAGVLNWTQLVMEPAGTAALSWLEQGAGTKAIKVARRSPAGTWTAPDAVFSDPSIFALYESASAVAGEFWFAWSRYAGGAGHIEARRLKDGIWGPVETVAVHTAALPVADGEEIQLDVDGAGQPTIAWSYGGTFVTSDRVLAARRSAVTGEWSVQKIADDPGGGYVVDVAVAADGAPFVLWERPGGGPGGPAAGQVGVARFAGGSWQAPTIWPTSSRWSATAGGSEYAYTGDVEAGADGTVAVAHRDGISLALRTWRNGTWAQQETVAMYNPNASVGFDFTSAYDVAVAPSGVQMVAWKGLGGGSIFACTREESATGAGGGPGVCTGDVTDDQDADGIANAIDNCPTVINFDQADDNKDGVGNVCAGSVLYYGPPAPPVGPVALPPGVANRLRAELVDRLRASLVPPRSLRIRKLLRRAGYKVTLDLEAPGKVTMRWLTVPRGGRAKVVAKAEASVEESESRRVKLALTRAGTRILKRARRVKLRGEAAIDTPAAQLGRVAVTRTFVLRR